MFCQNCGKQIEDNSVFCTNCGVRIGSAQGAEPVQNAAVTPASVPVSSGQPQYIKALRVMSIIGIVWFGIALIGFLFNIFVAYDYYAARMIGFLIAAYALPYAIVALIQAGRHKLNGVKELAVSCMIWSVIFFYIGTDIEDWWMLLGGFSVCALAFSIVSFIKSKKREGQQHEMQAAPIAEAPQAVPVQQAAAMPNPQAAYAAAMPNPQAAYAATLRKKRGKSNTKYWLIGGIALIVVLFWLCSDSGIAQSNVTEVNLGTLTSEINNNTARANQLYQGKTMRVSGYVIDIDNDFIWLAQYANSWVADENSILVYFNSSEMTKLANLNKGQRITVRGVYDGSIIPCIRRAVIE